MKWGELKNLIESMPGVTDETEVEYVEVGTCDPKGPEVYYDSDEDSLSVH